MAITVRGNADPGECISGAGYQRESEAWFGLVGLPAAQVKRRTLMRHNSGSEWPRATRESATP